MKYRQLNGRQRAQRRRLVAHLREDVLQLRLHQPGAVKDLRVHQHVEPAVEEDGVGDGLRWGV